MDSASVDIHTVRLSQIEGDANKTNDIVFCGHRRPADNNVIFFTGDVQVRLNVKESFFVKEKDSANTFLAVFSYFTILF